MNTSRDEDSPWCTTHRRSPDQCPMNEEQCIVWTWGEERENSKSAELDSPNFEPEQLREFRDRAYERRNRFYDRADESDSSCGASMTRLIRHLEQQPHEEMRAPTFIYNPAADRLEIYLSTDPYVCEIVGGGLTKFVDPCNSQKVLGFAIDGVRRITRSSTTRTND